LSQKRIKLVGLIEDKDAYKKRGCLKSEDMSFGVYQQARSKWHRLFWDSLFPCV